MREMEERMEKVRLENERRERERLEKTPEWIRTLNQRKGEKDQLEKVSTVRFRKIPGSSSHCLSGVGLRPSSSMSTGYVVPLKGD